MIEHDEEKVSSVNNYTVKRVFGCGNFYSSINEIDGVPVRVFLKLGKAGMCQSCLLESIARLLTIMFQDTDVPVDRVCKTLNGIQCDQGSVGGKSCVDALAKMLKKHIGD